MQASLKRRTIIVPIVLVSLLFMPGCWGTRSEKVSYNLDAAYTAENVIPIAVLGSGPAGLGAAVYGARENIKTVVFEGDKPGGLLMYTTAVANWPGHKVIMGPQIIKDLHEQAESAGAEFLDDTVDSVDFNQWPFVIHTVNDRTFHALSVVITTGANSRKLGIPGEAELWGQGVTACAVCDAHFFKGQDVVVVGGGDSAVEQALQLANHAKKITILVRKGEMRAAASMQKRLEEQPKISILYNVEIKRIIGSTSEENEAAGDGNASHVGHVTAVELFDNKTKKTYQFPTAGVFLAIGHIPNSSLFTKFLEVDEAGYIKAVDRTQETAIPGVVVAGEVEDNRYRQAGVSYGDGSKAALDALRFLRSIGFNKNVEQKLAEGGNLFETTTENSAEIPSLSTLNEVQAAITSNKPIVIDFYTQECVTCKHVMPIINSVAAKLAGSVSFYKVDTADESMIPALKKYSVESVPFLMVFNDGQPVARYNPEPSLTRKELEEFIAESLPGI